MDSTMLPTWTIRFGHDDQVVAVAKGPADDNHPPHIYIEFGGLAVVTVSASTDVGAVQIAREALTQDAGERRDRLNAAWREDTIARTEDEEFGGWWPITNPIQ